MNSYKYLDVLIVNVCRIIYNINNFPSHSDYIIRQERKDNLINLVKQACLYILYAFAFGMSLFSAYILLMLGCVLSAVTTIMVVCNMPKFTITRKELGASECGRLS